MATLTWIDYAIMGVYLVFVLGIGFVLKRVMKTSTDFFLSGRAIPAWITGLAFISANLGAQEVIGMGASGAKYGMMQCHFYWLGAIFAMVFVGIFMMPFYYGSKARSVPEYLKLRFDEKTRGFNAISFAVMTVFSSGVSMHISAKILNQLIPAWNYHICLLASAAIVLIYILLGGLTSAIYNEVLQFFLIVLGFLPLVYLALSDVGGWSGLVAKLGVVAESEGFSAAALPDGEGSGTSVGSWQHTPGTWTSVWSPMSSPEANPMGVEWFSMVMGLGFVLAFGYWCTDFLVVQRAMAANSMSAARRTPLIAAFPKMFFPFLVILPGMIALVVVPRLTAQQAADSTAAEGTAAKPEIVARGIIPPEYESVTEVVDGVEKTVEKPKAIKEGKRKGELQPDYNMATPSLLIHYFPTGLLGLGLTALMASFMSGMAGNVTAFNTVWTYDIYQSYIAPKRSDKHYLWMGRVATVFGTALSVAAAYVAAGYNNIMDLLQTVFGFVNAPLLATFLLGMFWRGAPGHGAFLGLSLGTLAAAIHQALTLPKGGWLGSSLVFHTYRSEMAQNFWTAIIAFVVCFVVTVMVSSFTEQKRSKDELGGLVYSLTPRIKDEPGLQWHQKPAALAVIVLVATIALNVIFW